MRFDLIDFCFSFQTLFAGSFDPVFIIIFIIFILYFFVLYDIINRKIKDVLMYLSYLLDGDIYLRLLKV